MRLSKFHKTTLWFIGLSILLILAFCLQLMNKYLIITWVFMFRGFSIFFLFAWTIGLAEALSDIVVLRYKLVTDKYGYINVKYLTFWWLIIPFWKPINSTYHSYETENLFGAKISTGYSTDIEYKSEKEALVAI